MKVTDLSRWEQLGGLQQGWSELAAHCEASPFSWPNFCMPWWYELGWGRLVCFSVEESGILVGLALLHDRVGDVGRHLIRFIGDEPGTYHQFLVADGRHDVTEVLWEHLLSAGRTFDLSSVPTEIAKEYEGATTCTLALTEHASFGLVSVLVGTDSGTTLASDGVRTVTDSSECIELLTGPEAALRWDSGEAGSKKAAFFGSMVDSSVRNGRMTLHLKDRQDGPPDGALVLHGAGISAVWRHVGSLSSDSALVQAVAAEAAERRSHQLLWPDSAGVPGQPFSLTDVTRVLPSGGRIRETSGLVRGAVRGVRDYLKP